MAWSSICGQNNPICKRGHETQNRNFFINSQSHDANLGIRRLDILGSMPARRANRGFTLIELLIVVTTIAILTLAGLIGYRLQIQKGYDTARKRDLNNIKVAFEHYYSDQSCYPSVDSLNNCGGN